MKQILCSFRYGKGKAKADNTYAEKIAFGKPSVWHCALSTQFFRHIIDNGIYRLSPLDSLTFAPRKPSVWRFGRLAATLWVITDSPLTAITDCFCRDAKAAFMRRYNKFPLARRPKGGIALVGSCTATILKNEKGKRFIKNSWKW